MHNLSCAEIILGILEKNIFKQLLEIVTISMECMRQHFMFYDTVLSICPYSVIVLVKLEFNFCKRFSKNIYLTSTSSNNVLAFTQLFVI